MNCCDPGMYCFQINTKLYPSFKKTITTAAQQKPAQYVDEKLILSEHIGEQRNQFMKSLQAIFSVFILSLSVQTHAQDITSACDEHVALEIIKFLEKEEPKSEIHLLKGSAGEIFGLTDVSKIYPTIDFVRTVHIKDNIYENIFQYDNVLVYADFYLLAPNGFISCLVTDVGTAQDDQD